MKTLRIFFLIVSLLILSNRAVAFDNTIVAGSFNGRVAIYHGQSSDPVDFWNIGSEVRSVDISQDGAYIVIGGSEKLILCGRDGRPVLWEKEIGVIKGWGGWRGRESNTVAISDDGRYIAACASDKLYLYTTEGTELWSHAGPKGCVSISPRGQYVAACNNDLYLFSIDSGTPLWSTNIGARWVAVSDTGYVAAVNNNYLYLYDKYGTKIWKYSHPRWTSDYMRVDMSQDGTGIIAGNDDPDRGGCALCYFNNLKHADPNWTPVDGTPKWSRNGTGPGSDIYSLSISEDGNVIVAGGSPSNTDSRLFRKESNQIIETFYFGAPQSFDLTYLGDYGAVGDLRGNVYYFKTDVNDPNILWQDNSLHSSSECYVQSVAIASVSLRLLTPNGGEELLAGTPYTIRWQHEEAIENINLYYSVDSGMNWTSIASDVPAENKECSWNVPPESSNQCLVRITVSGVEDVKDTSNAFFTIRKFLLTQPNGREELLAGDVYDIQWEHETGEGYLSIRFSDNNGDSWQLIEPVDPQVDPGHVPLEPNSLAWYVPYVISDECLIRLTEVGMHEMIDTSEGTFTVRIIDVTHPDGGEGFQVNEPNKISWRWNCDPEDMLYIEVSRDHGQSWEELGSENLIPPVNPTSAQNELGYVEWVVNGPSSDQCLIRLSDYFSDVNDISEEVFAIRHMQVLSPNGGEQLLADTMYPIEWQTDVPFVKIEYSAEYDGQWFVVDTNVPSIPPSYPWTVPPVSSNQCRVRISQVEDPINNYDISDDMFTIRQLQDYPPDPNDYISTDPNDYYWLNPDPDDYGIPGDITDSNYVDLEDFAVFSSGWPFPFPVVHDEKTDLNKDQVTDLYDLLILVSQWLYCNNPYDESCGRLDLPESWNWPYQCLGDANNSGTVGETIDQVILDNAMDTELYDERYYPAADFNRDGRVNWKDEVIFNYWKEVSPLPGPCKHGGWWPSDLK